MPSFSENCRARLCAIILLAGLHSLALGQSGPIGAKPIESQLPDWSFRKEVDEVYVVFAASAHGMTVPDLFPTDVSVVDDKKPVEKILAFYKQNDLPLRLGLLIDTSASVYLRFEFEQTAAGVFLRRVIHPSQDMGFVMGFSDSPDLIQDFTADPGELSRSVASMTDVRRRTALFDAVITACNMLQAHPENEFVARTLVVLSDGDDNTSHATLRDAIVAAQNANVTVYSISTRDAHGDFGGGDHNLKKLAEETGGRALFPKTENKLTAALTHTAEDLHSRYAICYHPADFVLDGHFRRIHITAEKLGKKLKVYARNGYYARATPAR